MPEPELGLGLEMPDRSPGRLTMMMKSRSKRSCALWFCASKNSLKVNGPFEKENLLQFLLDHDYDCGTLVSRQQRGREGDWQAFVDVFPELTGEGYILAPGWCIRTRRRATP